MKKIIASIVAFSPVVAFAQTTAPITDANTLSNKLINLGNMFTYLLIAAAVIFIIWNVVIYLIKGGEEGARSKAAMSILWGIVGLFVILSIWGLVNILLNTFSTRPPNNAISQVQNVNNGSIPTDATNYFHN